MSRIDYAIDTTFWIIEFSPDSQEPGVMVARSDREFLDFLSRIEGIYKIPKSLKSLWTGQVREDKLDEEFKEVEDEL